MKYRRFSSNRSSGEEIQRSPNHTRGRTPCAASSSTRKSVACSNSGMRVSAHSSRPNRNGEFAPSATCTPASACAAFQAGAKVSGETCRCSCTEVLQASGMIEANVVRSCSTPSISTRKSSPRVCAISSLSRK